MANRLNLVYIVCRLNTFDIPSDAECASLADLSDGYIISSVLSQMQVLNRLHSSYSQIIFVNVEHRLILKSIICRRTRTMTGFWQARISRRLLGIFIMN